MERLIESTSPEETFLLGKKLGQSIRGGTVICLYGDLGSGKTVLAKGFGEELGVTDTMTSPTFTLILEYSTKYEGLKLIHMDLYRLRHPEEAEVIGVTDYFCDDCICLLEWPEIIEDLLPEDRLEIRIQGSGDLKRSILLTGKEISDSLEI